MEHSRRKVSENMMKKFFKLVVACYKPNLEKKYDFEYIKLMATRFGYTEEETKTAFDLPSLNHKQQLDSFRTLISNTRRLAEPREIDSVIVTCFFEFFNRIHNFNDG